MVWNAGEDVPAGIANMEIAALARPTRLGPEFGMRLLLDGFLIDVVDPLLSADLAADQELTIEQAFGDVLPSK